MRVDVKFCGLTHPGYAAEAARLGAAYVGVILAGGPRHLSVEDAAAVLADVPRGIKRVGVFADQSADEIGAAAAAIGLDAVQLQVGAAPERIGEVRTQFAGEIWAVERVREGHLSATAADVANSADALVLDAYVPGSLGGTGVRFQWQEIATSLAAIRGANRIVVAGGLRPDNVGEAIAVLLPDVVDVSSGVEYAPGKKDPKRMRAFRDAVNAATEERHEARTAGPGV